MAGETILIVEDNKLNLKLIQTILSAHGYRLLVAEDGRAAVEIAAREHPDLILMDMRLPELTGFEATQILRAGSETARIPIMALTAHAMAEEREKALDAGCDEYITKPIDTRTFPSQVRQLLDREPEDQ